MSARRRGFTLIEVIFASVLLAVALVGIGQSLATLQRKSEPADQRLIANLLLQNALERLLLAGATPVDSVVGTEAVFGNDSVGVGGPYTRITSSTIVCNASDRPLDNATPAPTLIGCAPGTTPLRRWTVQVTYADPSLPNGRGVVSGAVTTGLTDRAIGRKVQP